MNDTKRTDTANEPVEELDDELMDTGVLHEKKSDTEDAQ